MPTCAWQKLNANLEQGGYIIHPAPFYDVKTSSGASTLPPGASVSDAETIAWIAQADWLEGEQVAGRNFGRNPLLEVRIMALLPFFEARRRRFWQEEEPDGGGSGDCSFTIRLSGFG